MKDLTGFRFFWGLLLFLVMPLGSTQEASTRLDLRKLKTHGSVVGKMSIEAGFVELVRQSGLSGGIISHGGCTDSKAINVAVEAGTSLAKALDTLSKAGNQTWKLDHGVIMLVPPEANPELLAVRISSIHVSDKQNLNASLSELLAAREVTEKAAALGITLPTPQLGFQKLERPDAEKPKETTVKQPIELRNLSLAEALNRIVAGRKGTVWQYAELRCAGRLTGRFLFKAE